MIFNVPNQFLLWSEYTLLANDVLKRNIESSIKAKEVLLLDLETHKKFIEITDLVVSSLKAGGRIYIAGNGGSAADAQHLAAEFVSKLARDRAPLAAEALTVDTSILTAIGNDYGFDQVFSRQLDGKATPDDVFLAITTSGNSLNIMKALETCKKIKVPSILFAGRDGGSAAALADYVLIAPGTATSTIQELHIVLAHSLCECVEMRMFD